MENHMSYLFNNEVGFVGNAVDAFNRLKVSQPFTLFDSQNRYQPNDKWDVFAATGGYTGYVQVESVRTLGVTLTAGSKCTVETKRVFTYQPGKSLLIINTFVWPTKIHGLRRRVGYFGITGGATAGIPYNGVYLEQNGLTLSINMASASLNTTFTVNQSDWNGDKFDGTGASGRTIDTSKGNIFWTDIEWLGVGDVRTGFFVDGRPVVAHTFHNDNVHPTVYMTTAVLPIRHEIENLTGLTGSHITKQICSTVMSEAGYEGFSRRYNVTKSGTAPFNLASAGTQYPMVAIRLPQNRLDAVIVPSNVSVVVEPGGNNKPQTVQYRILLNPTLTGGGWTAHFNGNVEYNTGASAVTGGADIIGGYISSSGAFSLSDINDFNYQIGRTQTGVSDVFCLTMTPIVAGSDVSVDLSWFEIV
jgi:hypothetical protein